jgi:S-adenosylmethionine synthetase
MFIPKNYSAESVTSGHPDKICDQISDAILDECLKQDQFSRVAVEVFGSHGLLIIGGEVTTKAKVDYQEIAKKVYRNIGYQDELKIIVNVLEQSPDISMGVDNGGAGDQGIMYGFACLETPECMPKGSILAHKLARQLEKIRRENPSILKPDGKTQVTIKNGQISTILISAQHSNELSQEELRKIIIKEVINPIVVDVSDFQVLVNPTGSFVKGGFMADTGLTGRKIMVDTYGGMISHGGGCFSGKDATKVDRSAAYMCRFTAKNLVANNYAQECLVSVAYAIGRAEPLMIEAVNEKNENLSELVKKNFDFRPRAIIEKLNLRDSLYFQTAAYGHFGREKFPWEKTFSF